MFGNRRSQMMLATSAKIRCIHPIINHKSSVGIKLLHMVFKYWAHPIT